MQDNNSDALPLASTTNYEIKSQTYDTLGLNYDIKSWQKNKKPITRQ